MPGSYRSTRTPAQASASRGMSAIVGLHRY